MAGKRSVLPRKRPRQERSRFMVDQILEAAARVFESRGYAGGTTNHIAEKAGVSVGSVYQYFPNKDAIVLALLERHVQEGVALVATVARPMPGGGDLRKGLRSLLDAVLALHERSPRLSQVLLHEAPRFPALNRRLHESEDAVAATVETLLAEAGVQIPFPRLTAWILVHTVENLAHEYVLHPPSGVDREDLLAAMTDFLISGLSGGEL